MSHFTFVDPSATLINEKDPYKKIELAGRTCYKSEDKITDESAPKFTRGLIKSGHTAMVEHQTFAFELGQSRMPGDKRKAWLTYFEKNIGPFLHFTNENGRVLISGNVRALNECKAVGPLLKVLQTVYPDLVYGDCSAKAITLADRRYPKVSELVTMVDIDTLPNLTAAEIEAHKYFTFRFVTDRGVTHEMVRHRPSSYAQESTRYVNYLRGISIALPTGFYDKAPEVQEEYQAAFEDANRHYGRLIEMGEKPQQARGVLPTSLKTEIVVTTNVDEWNWIFALRYFGTTGAPHPDIQHVMEKAYNIAKEDATFARYLVLTGAAS